METGSDNDRGISPQSYRLRLWTHPLRFRLWLCDNFQNHGRSPPVLWTLPQLLYLLPDRTMDFLALAEYYVAVEYLYRSHYSRTTCGNRIAIVNAVHHIFCD